MNATKETVNERSGVRKYQITMRRKISDVKKQH